MMSIYPKITLPALKISSSAPKYTQKISPKFDWRFGEFSFGADGKIKMSTPQESFEQWCVKVICTEQNSRLAYGENYGVDLAKIPTLEFQYAKSEIVRTITDAILAHPNAHYVKNLSFRVDGDNVYLTFDVKGKAFDEARRVEVQL